MPFDGVFIHYLVKELKEELLNKKITKIIQPNSLDIVLIIKGKNSSLENVTKSLLISSSLDMPRIYITNEKYEATYTPKSFCITLRKHIERGIIKDIYQVSNDRIIVFDIFSTSELGDELSFKLSFELMGRNSNIILIDDSKKIVDVLRKLPLSIESDRIILPRSNYTFPLRENAINPFNVLKDDFLDFSQLEGCSKLMQNEFSNSLELISYLKNDVKPYIFKNEKRFDFYCLPLKEKEIVKNNFTTLCDMLNCYYTEYKITFNDEAKNLKKILRNKIIHLNNKLDNLEKSIQEASTNIIFTHYGMLLQANLYNVKKGMDKIIVLDYLNNYEEVQLFLDPLLDPSQNLKKFFVKGKKAKSTITNSTIQKGLTENEISYLDNIMTQLDFASRDEIEEIKDELIKEKYLKQSKRKMPKNKKMHLSKYYLDNIEIVVGKNNLQNNYITHQLSNSYDYWFHVKDAPGSHVLFRCPYPNYSLSEKEIRFCANLASYFSICKDSSSVPVDYTLIKYIKKIPGLKGSEVTFTNQSTIYIDPDSSLIKTKQE